MARATQGPDMIKQFYVNIHLMILTHSYRFIEVCSNIIVTVELIDYRNAFHVIHAM